MKIHTSSRLVKMEDLNHHHTLFAVRGASWLIETSFATAACELGTTEGIVFRNINDLAFTHPGKCGDIIQFESRVVRTTETTITVHAVMNSFLDQTKLAESYITFVTIFEGTKTRKPHGIQLDEPADDAERNLRIRANELLAGAVK
ncbi:MAG: acyl-CoA thioesterase [Firmicutes bacterium]|nr:acyl-CoA thioesterase [Bacillota bacterium]